jgi:pimeloyl-ACP methyl ester carboxylesterase
MLRLPSAPFWRALALCGFLLPALLSSCKKDDAVPKSDPGDPAYRGELIDYIKTDSWTAEQVDSLLSVLGVAGSAQYGIDVYRVRYATVDARGESRTEASGALVVPTGDPGPFPLASYQHGTILLKEDVPSRGSAELTIGILFSSTGYITALPDFLGLGDSPGLHPYVHAKSEATASVDMLRASRTIIDELGTQENGQLFLFGYSQGGHATMALVQEIEARHTDEFAITAAAPMSGPYDLAGAQTDMLLLDEPYASPFYLPYVMLAYNMVYDMYPTPADFFKEPWASTVPPLFNGLVNYGELNAAVPAVPKSMVRDDVFEDFLNNPDNPFRRALEDNTQLDQAPKAPTRIYYCTGDEQVTYLNAINARDAYLAQGVSVTAINSEALSGGTPLNHGGCVQPTLLSAQIWFESLKE